MPSPLDHAARSHLRCADPRLGAWMDRIGELPLPQPERFTLVHALTRAIVFQQLNGKAAETIFGRVRQALGGGQITAKAITTTDDAQLRAAGLSANKLRALRDLAEHVRARRLPSLRVLHALDDEAAIEHLTMVRGIGPWTVQMLLMFRMGRPDVLPVSDYGVRAGAQIVHGLPAMPGHAELTAMGECWRPYRTLACLYLWRAVDQAREDPQG